LGRTVRTVCLVTFPEVTPVENEGAGADRFCGLSDQHESHFAIAFSPQSNRRRTEVKVRFWIAVVAQLVLFASLNLFDDWTLEWIPVYFVACAMLCGLAYLFAVTEFAAINKNAVWIFWLATIALRSLGLSLAPGNEVWRFQADGIIQRAGFNPYEVAPNDPRVAGKIPELARVPRTDEPTAFAPGAEVLFRAIPATNSALLYKIIFGAADLLAFELLIRLFDQQ